MIVVRGEGKKGREISFDETSDSENGLELLYMRQSSQETSAIIIMLLTSDQRNRAVPCGGYHRYITILIHIHQIEWGDNVIIVQI